MESIMGRKKRRNRASKLLEHIDDLLGKLRDQTPLALETFDAKAVHAARVTTRRLTAVLELMSPVLTKSHRKPLLKSLKRLRKRLGDLRDADVLLERIGEFPGNEKLSSAVDWMRDLLEKSRKKLQERSREKSPARRAIKQAEGWGDVRKEIDEANDAIDCLLAESLHLQVDSFAEQATRLSTPKEADVSEAADDEIIHRPHQLRIAGKNLRYTLEIAEACGMRVGGGVMRVFKKMQDQLGAWHDWVVLADRTLEKIVDEQLTMNAAAAENEIKLARRCLRRSSREMDRFIGTWRRKGTAIAERIRAAFPLTMQIPDPLENLESKSEATPAVTESETGPGPSGSAEPPTPGDVPVHDPQADGA
jgi:CHAD domain-containing protein